MFELRDYQTLAVNQIRAAFRAGKRSVLYPLSTGGGKSGVFNFIAAAISRNGRTAAIVVHRDELIHQNIRALELQGVPYGVIAPGYFPNRNPVQVASVWTLARRLPDWPSFDLVVFDEAHHLPSSTFAKVRAHYPQSYLLSVTATPARLDGIGLADYCEVLIQGPTMRELAEKHFLAPVDVFGPPTDVDLSHIHTRMGDFVQKELEGVMDKATITGSAVEHYGKLVPGRPAVAFCVSIKHCEHVAEQFRRAGYRAASIDGTMDTRQRQALIGDLSAGRLNVLTSCQLLTEGVDVPAAQAVILLRPTQSLTLFLQMAGRAMRPKPDGSPMILLDHVGNCLRHDCQTRNANGRSKGRQRTRRQMEAEVPGVRICPKCYAVFGAHLRKCPKCGHIIPVQSREIEEVPGQLVRLTPEERLAIWREEQRNPENPVFAQLHQKIDDEWLKKERARLQRIASEKGYKPGWVEKILSVRKAKKMGVRKAS